jgi:hypothetical protein
MAQHEAHLVEDDHRRPCVVEAEANLLEEHETERRAGIDEIR